MNEFKKNSVIMIVLTTLSSGINYLCQVAMGRVMSFSSFGVMNSLFSAILVLSVPGTSLNMLTAKQVAERNGDPQAAASAASAMCRLCAGIGILLCVVMTAASSPAARMLGTSPVMLILTGIVVATGLFPYIISGILAGRRAFLTAGLFSLIVPLCKAGGVALAGSLAEENVKQAVVLGAMVFGNLIAVFAFRRVLRPKGLRQDQAAAARTGVDRTTLLVMSANFIYLLFGNGDIFLVTWYLGAEPAGIYSASMLFGRILFFFTTALVSVLLPYVSLEKSAGGSPSRVFRNSLFMTLGVSLLCMIPINLFPAFFIRHLYGQQYLSAVPYVPFSCGVAVAVSLVNLELNYFIGIGQEKKVCRDLLVSLLVLIGLVQWRHGSVQVILVQLFCVLTGLFFYELRNCLRQPPAGGKKEEPK